MNRPRRERETEAQSEYMTCAEVAKVLGITLNTFYRMTLKRRLIPFYRPSPRRTVIRRADLNEYLNRCRVGAVWER